jgi:hypothetical protein
MSWSPYIRPRPRTMGAWHPSKVFNPRGEAGGAARVGVAGRTTRTRATRGRHVAKQRH